MEKNEKFGLAPLMCKEPKTLILGSLPSDISIESQEYYANPKNLFWTVMARIFKASMPYSYQSKKQLLADNHIALWDVYASAVREGSLDSNIKGGEFNDIAKILRENPTIDLVVTNGGKAKTAFTKYIRAHRAELPTDREIKVGYFNSTSSLVRSSGVTLEKLIEQWANICRN